MEFSVGPLGFTVHNGPIHINTIDFEYIEIIYYYSNKLFLDIVFIECLLQIKIYMYIYSYKMSQSRQRGNEKQKQEPTRSQSAEKQRQ